MTRGEDIPPKLFSFPYGICAESRLLGWPKSALFSRMSSGVFSLHHPVQRPRDSYVPSEANWGNAHPLLTNSSKIGMRIISFDSDRRRLSFRHDLVTCFVRSCKPYISSWFIWFETVFRCKFEVICIITGTSLNW